MKKFLILQVGLHGFCNLCFIVGYNVQYEKLIFAEFFTQIKDCNLCLIVGYTVQLIFRGFSY